MSIGFSLASCCTSVRCIVLRPGADELLLGHAFERQPVLADRLDMLGPRVDQGHVEPVMREVAAGIAADRAGADHRDALIHDLIPL